MKKNEQLCINGKKHAMKRQSRTWRIILEVVPFLFFIGKILFGPFFTETPNNLELETLIFLILIYIFVIIFVELVLIRKKHYKCQVCGYKTTKQPEPFSLKQITLIILLLLGSPFIFIFYIFLKDSWL